jgi:hypothetical protein
VTDHDPADLYFGAEGRPEASVEFNYPGDDSGGMEATEALSGIKLTQQILWTIIHGPKSRQAAKVHVAALCVLFRVGSFRIVAHRLGVSKSAVARAVAHLKEQLAGTSEIARIRNTLKAEQNGEGRVSGTIQP